MIDYIKKIIAGQFEAALCMMNGCIQKSPEDLWDGKIARHTFWQVAHHTLWFVDLYLSPNEGAFQPRKFHPQEWTSFTDPIEVPSLRFNKTELSEYLTMCREKATATLKSETWESLQGESGFRWVPFSRGELHLYNIRHVQHHTGQLSAYLRRLDETLQDPKALRWVGTGWK